MSILYRSEQKKIIKEQLNLINHARQILVDLCAASEKLDLAKAPESMQDLAYNQLLLKETHHEAEEREGIW